MANVTNSAAQLEGKTLVTAEDDQEVTGLKAFRRAPDAPIEVESGSAVVPNLDADKCDGEDAEDFHNASLLSAGTVPAGRFPDPLPAVSAAQLTSIPAANLTGLVPAASFPNPLPALSLANATAMPTTLPATSLANCTAVPGDEISGPIPDASVPTIITDAIANFRKISIVAPIVNPAGITGAINVPVWIYVTKACTVVNVRGYRVGGTGATINARRNGSENFLASNLSLTSADTQMDGGAVQNAALAVGDKVEVMLVSVTGTVTEVIIEIDLTVDEE